MPFTLNNQNGLPTSGINKDGGTDVHTDNTDLQVHMYNNDNQIIISSVNYVYMWYHMYVQVCMYNVHTYDY